MRYIYELPLLLNAENVNFSYDKYANVQRSFNESATSTTFRFS